VDYGYCAPTYGYADDWSEYHENAEPQGYNEYPDYPQAPAYAEYPDVPPQAYAEYPEVPPAAYAEYPDYAPPPGYAEYSDYAEYPNYAEAPEYPGYSEYADYADSPEMVGWGEAPDDQMGGYQRARSARYNPGCMLPTNVNGYGEMGGMSGYMRKATGNPSCNQFTGPAVEPNVTDPFRPLF
jgi:hypothetical protein